MFKVYTVHYLNPILDLEAYATSHDAERACREYLVKFYESELGLFDKLRESYVDYIAGQGNAFGIENVCYVEALEVQEPPSRRRDE